MTDDRIHAVEHAWKGPRRGCTSLGGVPHVFECLFDTDADGYQDVYWLSPLDPALLEAAVERAGIAARFAAAVRNGHVPRGAETCLPHDRARRDALDRMLSGRLHADLAVARAFTGVFFPDGRVEWTEIVPPPAVGPRLISV
jgi:hypothetical protein